MELRTACSPKDVKHYTTERLRDEFLIQGLFTPDEIKLIYSHIDRIIVGAATPVEKKLVLTAGEELRADYFLQRRELGVINIGGAGKVSVDGKEYHVGGNIAGADAPAELALAAVAVEFSAGDVVLCVGHVDVPVGGVQGYAVRHGDVALRAVGYEVACDYLPRPRINQGVIHPGSFFGKQGVCS